MKFDIKFLAEEMLGKLAKYLRALGYDTLLLKKENIEDIIRIAEEQERIILTKRTIFKNRNINKGNLLIITENNPENQLKEIIKYLKLSPDVNDFFSRCLSCNEKLLSIKKVDVEGKVPDYIFYRYDIFYKCPFCNKIYWPGSHFSKIIKKFSNLNP